MTEQLWAPWRLQYIENADRADGCIFCVFPAEDRARDAENLILIRGEHAFVMLNAYPYSNGHLMVIPYRHAHELVAYTDAEMLEVMQLTRDCVDLLSRAFHPDGFNLGVNMGRVAGAGIADHLHWHIVPRWSGDTNFMPVLADVRVIPESLAKVHARLRAIIDPDPEREKPVTGQAQGAGTADCEGPGSG